MHQIKVAPMVEALTAGADHGAWSMKTACGDMPKA